LEYFWNSAQALCHTIEMIMAYHRQQVNKSCQQRKDRSNLPSSWDRDGKGRGYMVTDIKQVAILSDNDSLARVVEINLSRYSSVEPTKLTGPPAGPDSQTGTDGFDLVVLAIGRLTTDPAAMLAQIPPGQARRAPLLIISSEPVWPDWSGEAYYLYFPFSASSFHRQVQAILNGETAAAPG
jgi:hypothetical protein